jgi:hypothetical protein
VKKFPVPVTKDFPAAPDIASAVSKDWKNRPREFPTIGKSWLPCFIPAV